MGGVARSRQTGVEYSRRRRWTFAGCSFDEENWSLTVGGQRVPIESKPLEILRELLLRAGSVVSKEALLDAIWGDVTVVEASLPTAVRKLRLALGDDRDVRSIIETVPAIGYRIAVPVDVESLSEASDSALMPMVAPVARSQSVLHGRRRPTGRAVATLGFAGLLLVAAAGAAWQSWPAPTRITAMTSPQRAQLAAFRRLDIGYVDRLLASGWDPNTIYDRDGNTALNLALEVCEYDPEHDRHDLLYMAQTLINGGVRLQYRNRWGDTAYSIARAKRFCGPDHPVTEMFRRICNSGAAPLRDRCMASYEIARGQHFRPES